MNFLSFPKQEKMEVNEYILQKVFENYKNYGIMVGIPLIESSSYVRSSYHAEELYKSIIAVAAE